MGILDDAIREHLELKRAHGASEDEVRRKEAEAFGPVRQDAAVAPAPAAAETPPAEPPETLHAEPSELDPLEPAPGDPYVVHPGDDPVPDPAGPHHEHAVDRADTHAAAEAGAGMLEPHRVEPGPPAPPEHHHDEPHPALVDHDHISSEEHPPEPVFGHAAEAPAAPAPESTPPDGPLAPSPIEDPPVGDPPVEHPDIDEPPPRQSSEPAAAHEVGPIEGPPDDPLGETPEFLQDAPEHDRLWFEQKPPRDFDFGE